MRGEWQESRGTATAWPGLWAALIVHGLILALFALRGDYFFRPDRPLPPASVVQLLPPTEAPAAPVPERSMPPRKKAPAPAPTQNAEPVEPADLAPSPDLSDGQEHARDMQADFPEIMQSADGVLEPPAPLSSQLPRSGEIRMHAYLGRYQLDSEPLGVGSLSVVFPQEGRYEIRLSAQAKGWAALFVREELRFYSEGKLTTEGLMPEAFESYTPFRGLVRSSFDALTGQAFLGSRSNGVPMPEAFQDRLSVIFQLAWIGQNRPGALEYGARHILTVAGNRDFRATTFTVEGPDDLVLPGGILVSAIRLMSDKVSGGRRDGQIEVWLDPSDRFLPARILFLENSGQAIDFLAIRSIF